MMNINNIPPITKNLLILNIVVFFGINFLLPAQFSHLANDYLAAYFPTSEKFYLFQIITHMFMHANFSHILGNMFGIWVFGSAIENYFGQKKFLILYFASGLGAYALHQGVNYFQFMEQFQNIAGFAESIPGVVGASGCLFGILAAFILIYPNVPLLLIFFPVPIKAKYLIGAYMLYELYSGYSGVANMSMDNIAHFAHIGGAIVGFLLVKYWEANKYRIQ